MRANEYQQLALRTMASQEVIQKRIAELPVEAVQMVNSIVGLQDEVGELAGNIKRWVEYGGKPVDVNYIREEAGDILWRLAQLCDANKLTLEECMVANIRKLAVRYGDKYDDFKAQEENRNREAEYKAFSSTNEVTNQGFSEPTEL